MSAAEIAAKLQANQDATERLLNGCVALELLTKSADGRYSLTPTADRYLRRDSPTRSSATSCTRTRRSFPCGPIWKMPSAKARIGGPRHFGPERELFSHFFRTDESMRTFLQGMHGLGMLGSPKIAAAHDLSGFHRFVDLGGATGHLAIEVKRRYGQMHCAVFDLPKVIEVAREFVSKTGLDIELIPGDFFRDELPPADLYAVGRIFHDWNDESVLTLLRKMHSPTFGQRRRPHLRAHPHPDKTGSLHGLMQSLNMLIVTEGKERTEAEYTKLLAAAGFGDIVTQKIDGPVDAILARKHPGRAGV